MQLSAEIRWFWQDNPPSGLESWFKNSGHGVHAPGGGGPDPRVDEYFRDPSQRELGLKIRGRANHGIEIKGLVAADLGGLSTAPFTGSIELWCKWISAPLELKHGSTIAIHKWRLLRKFDASGSSLREIELAGEMPKDKNAPLPEHGCNVELTRIEIPANGQTWWTLGFESFGTMTTVGEDLRATAATLAARQPPSLGGGLLASYPAWLEERILPALGE